ncbi:MAG: PocR ligand-binding domain-containing protein [Treponemataceae bacterium]
MPSGFPQLDYIINAENFRRIQDSLAEATEMAMLTVDFKGTPVTTHSRCSDYCAAVRAVPALSDRCRKCDSRGGLEAARIKKPYIYLCHMDLLDFAVPIVVDDHYLGAIMAGQVRVRGENGELERIAGGAPDGLSAEKSEELAVLRDRLPTMTLDRVNVIARMMFHICNYIVEEALVKLHLMENYRADGAGEPGGAVEKQGSEKTGSRANIDPSPAVFAENPIIKPALDYIRAHYAERFTLEDMASRCNISPSYFSKIFNRETGDNFAGFVNRTRVRKARELLLSSDQAITTMAMDLGFEDSGYFDKVFKKTTGLTPSDYRNRGGRN